MGEGVTVLITLFFIFVENVYIVFVEDISTILFWRGIYVFVIILAFTFYEGRIFILSFIDLCFLDIFHFQ